MLIGFILAVSLAASLGVCLLSGSFQSLAWLWVLPVSFLGGFLLLAVLAFLFLWLCCATVDTEKEQEKDSKFWRWLIPLYAQAILTILGMRMEVKGLENVPKEGRFVLVCNHLHVLDPVILLYYFRKNQLAFISKKENKKLFLVGQAMHRILCQPLDRDNDRQALKVILKCIRILKEDQASVAIFPEGYTSKDEKLHPFRSGVFKIAQKAQVPIVVCTLRNTRRVFGNIKRLRATHVPLHVVGVVRPEEYGGLTTVELGDRIHTMMAQDLGPENVLSTEENT